jgi:tRNA(Ile)-lysidine synthetase-like protein
MNIKVSRGKYVVAVSGGVDSMALLDLLASQPQLELVVAHFNHGIRPDSSLDTKLVKKAARRYGLSFEAGRGDLGQVSEATARLARYEFLEKIRGKYDAKAIITAHHQDDLIETALINLLRGTGRQGLTAIVSNSKVIRPLLSTPKQTVIKYAQINKLDWRDDSTNQSTDYLRNYLRLNVLLRLSYTQRRILISNLDKVAKINKNIDIEFATLSRNIGTFNIDRQRFSSLPNTVANEYTAYLFRSLGIKDYDSQLIKRTSLSIKTARADSEQPIKRGSHLRLTAATASILTS